MDATTALPSIHAVVGTVVSGLTPEQRDLPTPNAKWTVHDTLEHVCQGGHAAGAVLRDQVPDMAGMGDVLADGPVAGWQAAAAALASAATPEALDSAHQFFSFGPMPGEVILSIMLVDHLVHAWDLATATGGSISIDDEIAVWALAALQSVVPVEGRDGDSFKDVVAVDDSAGPLDRLIAYSGRNPS